MNNPLGDVIDRALRALSNATEFASNDPSGAEILPIYQRNGTLKIARNSIYRSHGRAFLGVLQVLWTRRLSTIGCRISRSTM
jgi:hypothetical protein